MALSLPASLAAVPGVSDGLLSGAASSGKSVPAVTSTSTGGRQHRAFPISASSVAVQRRRIAGFRPGSGVLLKSEECSAAPTALIDIEDGGDGSVTFKYGPAEDVRLDRLLENLYRGGSLGVRTAETFVRAVVELFAVPETASQAIATAAAEYLRPSSVVNYRGSSRYSAGQDEWWRSIDSFLGIGEGTSVDDVPEHILTGPSRTTFAPNSEENDAVEPLRSKYFKAIDESINRFVSRGSSNSSVATQSEGMIPSNATETPSLEGVAAAESGESVSSAESVEQNYTFGADFVLPRPRESEVERGARESTKEAEAASDADVHFARQVTETLPAASIRDMFEWQQEDLVTSSVARSERPQVKKAVKKTAQRAKPKAPSRERVTGGRVRPSSSKRKAKPAGGTWRDSFPCDFFFALPMWHKRSGVASVLAMRKNFGQEMQVVLNHASIGLGAAGLATTLQVGARMLSVNATFDRFKLLVVIRGAALLWLSTAMEALRKAMLRLPGGCSISDLGPSGKSQLQCLQHQLRRLSFTVLVILVISFVGHVM